jgi:hypothetical protein
MYILVHASAICIEMPFESDHEPAPPITGPERVSLVRDLALGTYKHRQLADKYGRVSTPSAGLRHVMLTRLMLLSERCVSRWRCGAPRRKSNLL